MERLCKNIQLILVFFKAPFLVLNFSHYTLMTFLVMLSVILLSLLMILSIVRKIRHLINGINYGWLLNLNLIYKTLRTQPVSGLLISMLKKFNLFHLTSLITQVLLMWQCMGILLKKNHLLKCWNCLSPLNWTGALTLSLLHKLLPNKSESLFILCSFFLCFLPKIYHTALRGILLSCLGFCFQLLLGYVGQNAETDV